MSDDTTPPVPPPYPGQQPPQQPQPNWGSAYPPPGQPGQYPPPPGYYPPPGYGYQLYPTPPPKHPKATTAMVLGIVAVAGGLMACGLPTLIAPFAWLTGHKAVKEIDASGGTIGGRSEAHAGKILGIVGTVMLVLIIAAVILFIVLSMTIDNFWDDGYDDGVYYEDGIRGALAFLGR